MKQDVKAAWIEALNSDAYEQGAGCLRDYDNKYCCLGVLCEIYRQENPEIRSWEMINRGVYTFCTGDQRDYRSDVTLPPPVREWAGLQEHEQEVLADLNDGGVGFSLIAQTIAALL